MSTDATGTADTMMTAAIDLTTAAMAMEVVAAGEIRLMFSWSRGNASHLSGAARRWRTAADRVSAASSALTRSVSGVPAQDWTAADRDAYHAAVDKTDRQLGDVHDFLAASADALEVAAAALVGYDVLAVGVAVALVDIGAAILASEASLVGSADVPALEAVAWALFAVVAAATAALAEVGIAVGGVLQAAAVADARDETRDGNRRATGDLATAEGVGAAAALANLTQDFVNAGVSVANRGSGVTDWKKTLGRASKGERDKNSTSLGAVDLDADRNWRQTWKLGGSATWHGATVGGHGRWDEDGYRGADARLSYDGDPVNAGVDVADRVDDRDGHTVTTDSTLGAGSDKGSVTGAVSTETRITGDGRPRSETVGVDAKATDRYGDTWASADGSASYGTDPDRAGRAPAGVQSVDDPGPDD